MDSSNIIARELAHMESQAATNHSRKWSFVCIIHDALSLKFDKINLLCFASFITKSIKFYIIGNSFYVYFIKMEKYKLIKFDIVI